MDIRCGFKIDEPDVFVPWDVNEDLLGSLIGDRLRVVLKKKPSPIGDYTYYVVTCKSLDGLNHKLGFHFKDGNLYKLEFFRKSAQDIKGSFEEFQRYFEKGFGPPLKQLGISEGFPIYEWTFGKITILHWVNDRFGLEEHMEITRKLNSIVKQLKKWALRFRVG